MARMFASIPSLLAFLFGAMSASQATPEALESRSTPEWVTRSDQNAKLLLAVDARFYPEGAASLGISGLDDQIIDLKPQFQERHAEATEQATAELVRRLQQERDDSVRQDLEILIESARRQIRGTDIRKKYFIQFYDANEIAYWGIEALLDPPCQHS